MYSLLTISGMNIIKIKQPVSVRQLFDSQSEKSKITLFRTGASCGFPSPADDYAEDTLSLNEHVISHPAATYFVQADGDSMQGVGIYSGDLLVVNRALTPVHGDIVIVAIDGQITCKQLDLDHKVFRSANPNVSDININTELSTVCEGVVTHCIHYLSTTGQRVRAV